MIKKLLITGCRGQLGQELTLFFRDKYDVFGVDLDDYDITHPEAVNKSFADINPDIVFHTSALTDVAYCEKNPGEAEKVNVFGTANIARACREFNSHMIYFSSDYVFAGESDMPYIETDTPSPINVYGKTKLMGEEAIAGTLSMFTIIRTAWLYGKYGHNFVRSMIKKAFQQNHEFNAGKIITPLTVVDNQIGNPTWTLELARQLEVILDNNLTGIVHVTSEGRTNWYDFARSVFEILSLKVQMRPCKGEDYSTDVKRPSNSALENSVLNGKRLNIMKPWRDALEEFLVHFKR